MNLNKLQKILSANRNAEYILFNLQRDYMKNYQCSFFSLISAGKIFLSAMCLAFISGCAAIKGTSNTNNYEKIDLNSMVTIEQKMDHFILHPKLETDKLVIRLTSNSILLKTFSTKY